MAFGVHWEWRGFGEIPAPVRVRIEALPLMFDRPQDVTDEYLWVPGSRINVKLRFSDLKFKRLVESSGCLERWLEDPDENYPFPLDRKILEKLAADLGIKLPPVPARAVGREAFLELMGGSEPPVKRVAVQKSRLQREWAQEDSIEPVIVDIAEILAPERLVSVGLEHPEADRVRAALDALGLARTLRPLSYLAALSAWARGGKVGRG